MNSDSVLNGPSFGATIKRGPLREG
jgi:hypothetical protein